MFESVDFIELWNAAVDFINHPHFNQRPTDDHPIWEFTEAMVGLSEMHPELSDGKGQLVKIGPEV